MKIDTMIEEKISAYLVDQALQGDPTGFDHDTDLIAIAAIDSLSMMDLVVFLENTFMINISPVDLNPTNLKSVRAIAGMVRKRRT